MGNLTGLVPLVLIATHHPDRVHETAQVDEAKVECEEQCSGDQPDHDQGKFGTANRDRIEDGVEDGTRNGSKRLIDCLVDAQGTTPRSAALHSRNG